MFLTELSIKKPVLMTIVMILLVIFGLVSYNKLSLDLYPEVDVPVVVVSTVYKGAGPEEVETLITDKIEETVSSINGIDKIESTSQEGISTVVIRFDYEADIDIAGIDVKDKVDLIRHGLPDDAEAPVVQKLDINAMPIMRIAVQSDTYDLERIYYEVDEYIKNDISNVNGVSDVAVIGKREREIQVLVKQKGLESRNISIPQLISVIKNENLNFPSGHITEKNVEYNVRVDSEFKSIDDIRKIKIPTENGNVYLTEIADVVDYFEEQREVARRDGKSVIGLSVRKRPDANTVDTAVSVAKKIKQIQKSYKGQLDFNIVVDKSDFIKKSVEDVNSNIIMAILITAFVLFLFLQNFRTTFIISVSMPVAVIASFSVIYFMGFTLNMMTLMALALSVGMLVNNSIIVLENIDRHILKGDTPENSAITGTNEIALAILGATFTNVVVFVPIAYMGGMVGRFFKQFGLTMAFITVLSLFISYTLTPMMCAKLLRPKEKRKKPKYFKSVLGIWDKGYSNFENWYKKALAFVVKRAKSVIFGSFIVFLCSFTLFPFIGKEFITQTDEGEFQINIEMAPGTSLSQTDEVVKKMEALLKEQGSIDNIFSSTGSANVSMMQGSNTGVNVAQITVKLKENGSTREYMNKIRKKIAVIPGPQKLSVLAGARHGGGGGPLQVEILAKDMDILNEFSQKVMDVVKENSYTVDVQSSLTFGKPEVKITPNRLKIKEFNIDARFLADTLRSAVEGITASEYREKGDEYDIVVKLNEDYFEYIQDIYNLNIVTSDGRVVALKQIADIRLIEGPSKINRKDRRKMVLISGDVKGKSIGKVAEELNEAFDKITVPDGCEIRFGGEVEKMKENFGYLLEAFWLAIILTYFLIAAILESFKKSIFMMMTLPLGFIGAFVILFLTNTTFSIFSLMAIIMLVGIVVNNAILLIDYIDVLRKKGHSLYDAIMEACPAKLRAIFMTALTTIFAMIPLALGLGSGGEIRRPMAVVSIGAITANLFLSIFVIPAIYYLIEKRKK
jgi:hydrophobic/amphiphilic exporter-1 (mainly G- bacteria), HAE1 family